MFATNTLLDALELSLVFVVSVAVAFYFYHKKCYTYWKNRGLPTASPTFPLGDMSIAALGFQSIFERVQDLYTYFKSQGYKNGGLYFFNGPIYFPVHPDMVKRVLVTDFSHFMDRGTYINGKEVPLSVHMFSMQGDEWKSIRNKFSPTFTSGKMRSMYNILHHNYGNLMKKLESYAEKEETIDIKLMLTRVTTDVIGSAAFGIDCNSLENPNTEFVQMVERIFQPPVWRLFKIMLVDGLQNPGNLLKVSHDDKTVERYFVDLIQDTIEYRDKNNVMRDDFMNVLMQMRSSGISLKEIVAEAFLFFTAGFETSSSTMSFCIHELAHNQDLQDTVREEVRDKLGHDSSSYTYEDIMTVPILDRIIKETLRKYPPVGILNRICVKPYQVPETSTVIEKGTPVIISVLGLHRDPEYFPDPMKFDPDRFNSENKLVPFSYIPFGDGPRNCIGLRFGMMQTKLGIASLLNQYKFLPTSLSPPELELDPSTTTIVMNVKGGKIFTKILKV